MTAHQHPRQERPRRSRRRGAGSAAETPQLTSQPTHRAAYLRTREWLLDRHGPACAYCASRTDPREITLDHVTPRRGQTAYDRRDNLVLACRACNEAKRDLSPLAYLLAVRARAANLIRYGAHLSPGLLDLARSLMPKGHATHAAHAAGSDGAKGSNGSNGANGSAGADGKRPARELLGITDEEDESPYRD